MASVAPSPTRNILNDVQAISHGILADGLHDHGEPRRITVHIPKKEGANPRSPDDDRKVQMTSISERNERDGDGRRERHDHSQYGVDVERHDQSATIRSLAKDVEWYRHQLRSTQKELEEATRKQRYTDSEKNLDALKRTNSELLQEVQKCKERESMNIQTAQKLAKDAEQKNATQERDNATLRTMLRGSENEIQRMAAVLRERTADLKGAQTFLNTADLYSGAEVINMVESLNTEFFQISAFIADLIEDEGLAATKEEWTSNKTKLVTASSNDAQFFAGNKLYTHISSMNPQLRTDALPLQLALQAVLTGWCIHHVRIFCWGPSHQRLHEIYRSIQSSETQAVSGRWRAITAANIVEDHSNTKPLFDVIWNLLHLCGLSSSSAQAERAATTIKDMLISMQKQIVQLRKAVREGITTADLEVFAPLPGTTFNEKMEDIYKTSAKVVSVESVKENKRILCTVGMGLRKSVGKNGGDLAGQIDILLKPQVVLESILDDTDSVVPDV